MPIQIHLLAGPQAGRRIVMRNSPVTVGRDPSCDIVIDEPAVSRRQLRLEQNEFGDWFIVNESEQGTTCGWRRLMTTPRQVRGTIKLSVSSIALLEVTAIQEEQAAAASTAAESSTTTSGQAQTAGGSSQSGKTKLWIGIGVFWMIVIVLGLLLSTMSGGAADEDEFKELTPEQIKAEIYEPPSRHAMAPQERQVAFHLEQANRNYELRDQTSEALFRSYTAYRDALSYTSDLLFDDGANQRRYQIVQEMLARELVSRYQTAENKFLAGEYEVAIDDLRDLQSFYPVGQRTMVGQNIEELLRKSIQKNTR